MSGLTREEAARRGRLGALRTHAIHDPHEITSHARRAFLAKFGTPQELSAYFAELGRLSGTARRLRGGRP